jgi:hypothetical protein
MARRVPSTRRDRGRRRLQCGVPQKRMPGLVTPHIWSGVANANYSLNRQPMPLAFVYCVANVIYFKIRSALHPAITYVFESTFEAIHLFNSEFHFVLNKRELKRHDYKIRRHSLNLPFTCTVISILEFAKIPVRYKREEVFFIQNSISPQPSFSIPKIQTHRGTSR